MPRTSFQNWLDAHPAKTTGWEQGCECNAGDERDLEAGDLVENGSIPLGVVPCTCLDPFAGAGTVGVVARGMGLNFIGIELNPVYAEMARKRIENPEPVPVVEDVEGQMGLFEEKETT